MSASRSVVEKASGLIFLTFSAYLLVTVAINSAGRRSVFATGLASNTQSEEYFSGVREKGSSPKVRLQDFRRKEVENGRTIWEVEAEDARYYGSKELTHLKNSVLKLYQEDGREIEIHSDSSRLKLNEQSLDRADMAGNLRIELDGDITLTAPSALFLSRKNEITSAERASVQGEGFQIEGTDLRVDIDGEVVELYSDVSSVFEPGKRPGKALDGR